MLLLLSMLLKKCYFFAVVLVIRYPLTPLTMVVHRSIVNVLRAIGMYPLIAFSCEHLHYKQNVQDNHTSKIRL